MIRVLALISFDAVAQPLLHRMIAQGRLPHCAELLSRGKTYEMESTPLHASVYRTLYTGRSLSEHGSHYPTQWSAAEQRMTPAEPMKPEESIFARLDRAEKRILVIDPPECGRFTPARGIAICGWQFHARPVLPEWYSSPSIRKLLREQFGPPDGCHEVFGPPSMPRLRAMRDVLQSASQRLADATAACLRQGPFDFVWVTFAAPHIAGHQLWRDSLDKDSPAGGDEPALLAGIYERADDALGQVLAALPAGTDIILFSPNGMGPETSRSDLLPSMLAKVLRQSSARRADSPLSRLRAWVPTGLRAKVADALPDSFTLRLTALLENGHPDWSTTRAFAVTSDGAGFVRLNLQGREREGIVSAGEAQKLLCEIATGLATFVEPSGEKVVHAVLNTAELDAPGPMSALLPDLIVVWSDRPEAGLRRILSPEFGEVLREGVGSGRVGNHREGTWACVVPGGSRQHAQVDGPVRAIDFATTACAAMEVACDDLPGRSLFR